MTIDLDQQVREAYEALYKSRTAGHTIIFGCDDKQLKVVLLEEIKEGITLDDLANKLPNNEPRLVITMQERVHRDGHKSYPIILIAYCPAGLAPQVNIVYTNSRITVAKEFKIQYVWEEKKRFHIGDEELVEKFETNKW